jgi:hypothetical protein
MSEQPAVEKEPVKNIHLEVTESFHQRLKVLCVLQKTTLKDYGQAALEEKVARDDKAIGRGEK